jgi:mono/diheme cytochrome c family protein
MTTFYHKPFVVLAFLGLAACQGDKAADRADVPSGAEDFANYCAGCHGAGGKGDGPAAAGLAKKPADLTKIAARSGGAFQATQVMAQIWGYQDARDGGRVMPKFSELLDSPNVLFDGGDGIATPTPLRLVQLAEVVQGLQK